MGKCEGSKLRFVRKESWKEKAYIRKVSGGMMVRMMKIRLSMTKQEANYMTKYAKDLEWPLCNKEEDTTEHVLNCEKNVGTSGHN